MGLDVNLGTLYGNGYVSTGGRYSSSSASGSSSSSTYNKVASNTKLNRIEKDIAEGYGADFDAIETYIAMGEIDKAIDEYQGLFDSISSSVDDYGYELTDKQKNTVISKAYQYATGEKFTTAITEGTDSSFMTGLKKGIPFLGYLAQETSTDEALAKATGTTVKDSKKAEEFMGTMVSSVVGDAVVGAVGVGIAGAIKGAITGSAGGPVGILVGAGAGAMIGIASGIIKSVVMK